jgi:D-arginine dehydrogenase
MQDFDFAIIGAGIAGVSAAYHLAPQAKVIVRWLDPGETLSRQPLLKPAACAGGAIFEEAEDMDVAAIHGGFLKGARAAGAALRLDAEVTALGRKSSQWRIELRDGDAIRAAAIVNAAGAWADVVAGLAGAAPVGLVPKRRTAFTFDAPAGLDLARLPMAIDFDETWYIKPEVGQFLGSPADETPSPPCDAQPEELDIAIAVDRIETATTLRIGRIKNKWAGLRSFVADKNLVIGYDPAVDGFFWLAGQGGYGIQTGGAAGRLAASLALGKGLPADIAGLGVTEAALSPRRFTQR